MQGSMTKVCYNYSIYQFSLISCSTKIRPTVKLIFRQKFGLSLSARFLLEKTHKKNCLIAKDSPCKNTVATSFVEALFLSFVLTNLPVSILNPFHCTCTQVIVNIG